MATTFYLTTPTIVGANRFARYNNRGTGAATVTGTTNGSTWVSIGFWYSRPLVAFTLSGTVTMNVWGYESANQANASFGMRIYRYTPATATLSASLGQASNAVELGTGTGGTVKTATVTPTSTAFSAGDMIVAEVGIVNAGTMGNGQTVTLQYNGTTAAAAGDSFFTITENVELQNRYIISR